MVPILQDSIPYDVAAPRPLPGITSLSEPWALIDEVYDAQMSRRIDLLTNQREDVHFLHDEALAAGQELLRHALALLGTGFGAGFSQRDGQIRCPDGRDVLIDFDQPLITLGQLLQEDFCILQKPQGSQEHILNGAVLCFPASWMLSEKACRPLIGIHDTVAEYDANIAARVQRLFDGVQVGRPLWRFNALWYEDPELHQPRSVNKPRKFVPEAGQGAYLRSERQCIFRLPQTRSCVFSIHTFVLPGADQDAS